MTIFDNLLGKYMSFKAIFKNFFLLVILFLLFFAFSLFIAVKNKPQSAYTALDGSEKSNVMLQDTRVHNWSELEKKSQK